MYRTSSRDRTQTNRSIQAKTASYAVIRSCLAVPPCQSCSSRRREQTKEFKDGYRLRGGIEATNSEYKRSYGGGCLRVRGSPAVARTVKFKFMALNIKRWMKPARKTAKQAA